MPSCTSEDKPDKYIEEVWLGIKNAVNNTFSQKRMQFSIDLCETSNLLNKLQSECNYTKIEEIIMVKIGEICREYITNEIDVYNCHILDVQIKRWNKVTKKYKFFENQDVRVVVENCILFYIYFKIIDNEKKYITLINIFKNTQGIPNIHKIIDCSLSSNYPIILDKCNRLCCVSSYINTKFKTSFHKNTHGIKIINVMKSKKLI